PPPACASSCSPAARRAPRDALAGLAGAGRPRATTRVKKTDGAGRQDRRRGPSLAPPSGESAGQPTARARAEDQAVRAEQHHRAEDRRDDARIVARLAVPAELAANQPGDERTGDAEQH